MEELPQPLNDQVEVSIDGEVDQAVENGVSTRTISDQGDEEEEKEKVSTCRKLINFYWENEFLILVVVVILLAKAYPPLGAEYLAEEITAAWIAVILIFGERRHALRLLVAVILR